MTPVQYTPANKAVVDAFEAQSEEEQSGDYWSDEAVTTVRAQIKQHHIQDQNYCCVYCSRQIVTDNQALWDAEHIIPRSLAVRFMFVPENLAVSCKDCNLAKKEKEVRVNPNRKSFPVQSAHYLIAHPHFDNYSDHIRWFGNICAPISPKGIKTISLCNLSRFTAEKLGIHGFINEPEFDDLVGRLVDAKTPVDALATLAALKVYAENVPQD